MRQNITKKSILVVTLFTLLFQFFIFTKAKAQWSAVGAGACDMVYAISPDVAGTGIYLGMYYNNCVVGKNYIQATNGTATPANLNTNAYVNGFIYAIAVSGTNVYVGGDFTTAMGVAGFNGIACWNTSTNTWSTLGTGVAGSNKTVYSLLVDPSTNILYVGGEFTTANGTTVNNVAAYNIGTSTWAAMSGGVTGLPAGSAAGTTVGVYALTKCGSNIYAGGRFNSAGASTVNNIASWNGASWGTLTSGGQTGVTNVTVVGPNIACPVWDAAVMALTSDGTTNVYAGGDFDRAGGSTGYHNMGAWNTTTSTWSKMGNGMTLPNGSPTMPTTLGDNANVYALCMYNGNVVAGGDFEGAGTVGSAGNSLFIAQWNGSAWSNFSTGCGGAVDSDIFSVCVSNGTLYCGGQQSTPNIYLAKYTGAGPSMTINVGIGSTICSGSSVALSASGATTYSWVTSAGLSCTSCSSPTASPTSTTVYTVTGTTSGCSSSKTVTVTVVATPTITISGTTNLCQGGSTVLSATSSASTYTWSANAGGVNTNTASVTPGLGTTVYTVSGTNGTCVASKTVSVTVVASPTVNLSANSYTICNGSSTGLSASGATTYTWTTSTGLSNPNSATPTASPTTTTIYTVTGTSSGCNSSPVTATVNVTPLPTLTTTATSNSVCTSSSATLSVSGASTYTWSPSGSLSSPNGSPVVATPTASTTYTVTGTSSGCSSSNVVTIAVNPLPTVNISPSSATVCPTGTATLMASGANTYTWSPASTLNTSNGSTVVATPTASTVYTVSGTSAAGCTNTNTVSVAVNPTLAVTVNSPTTCAGIGVLLTANGASSYSWSPAAGLSSTSGQTVTATGSSTTQYTVTGTSGGCVGTNTSVVTINPQPTLSVSATSTAICAGSSATLTASGANTYSWAPAGGLSGTTGAVVTATPTSSVTYFVIGTDGNGCKDTNQVAISVTPPPDVTAQPATICSGQSSTLTVSGVATSYTWSANAGGATTSTVVVNPTTTTVYTVTATSGPCVLAVTTTVTVNSTPSLTLGASSYTICSGDSTVINSSGASSYTWTTGSGLNCTSCATPTANPASTTVYTVTGENVGCLSAPATVTVNVNLLPDITTAANTVSVCVSSSATLTANGGTSYTWSPAGSLNSANGSPVVATPTAATTYTVTGENANGCRNTSTITVNMAPTPTVSIAAVPSAVCAGQSVVLNGGTANSYTWSANAGSANTGTVAINPTVTDTYTLTGSIGSCTDTATVTVPVNSNPVITSSVVTAAPCGQSTGCVDTVVVASGTPTYTYSWNGGSGSTVVQYCGHPSGIYTLTVTDANGCSVTNNINIPSQNGPAAPTVTASTNSVCVGGTVTMTVNPATPGIVYGWTDISGTTTGTSYTVANINPAGNYTLTVTATDTSINCSNSTSSSIAVVALPTMSISATDTTLCSGQSTVLTASGASSYTWTSPSATTATVSVNPSVPTTYTVAGSSNGCSDTQTITIGVNPTPTITVNGNPGAICSGETLTLSASGATSFTWNPTGANTNTISVGPASTATYVVTGDALGCTSQQLITVTVTPTPSITVMPSSNAICSSQSATLTAAGAGSYSWSTGSSSSTLTVGPTASTTYTVIGFNGNCSDTAMFNLTVNPTPSVAITPNAPFICAGQTLTLTASGGATTYTWLPSGVNTPTFTDAPTGTSVTYTLIGTTGTCTSTPQSISVNINAVPSITVTGGQSACSGGQISTINYNSGNTVTSWTNTNINTGIASSGTGNINSYTAPNVTTTQTGTITAIPTDTSTGCAGTAQDYTVAIYPNPTIASIYGIDSAKCGAPIGSVHGVVVAGGTPQYTYQWYDSNGPMTGQTDSTLSNVPMGTYTVVITDQNGCTVPVNTNTFTVNGTPVISTTITPPLSQGQAPLTVTFSSISSGATSYSWNFGNGQSSAQQQPVSPITYTAAGIYTVTLDVYNSGCHAMDTALVIIDAIPNIIVPNVYSPNGDGINDTWFITATGYCTLHCDVYNRWGQLVYQLLAVNDTWNGVMNNGNHASEGTYYYILEATTCDGKSTCKADGWITLVK